MEREKPSKKICLQCGKPITGRLDKKYCDDYCRNMYNNQTKRADEKQIQQVNSIIRKNRRILKTLCPVGKATVRKEVLDAMGYNYRYFSGLYRSSAPRSIAYFICYDYAFSPVNEKGIDKALIVQKQDYFDKYLQNPWPA
jgi:predicted nucleic acid-binding Zn ribbon protein